MEPNYETSPHAAELPAPVEDPQEVDGGTGQAAAPELQNQVGAPQTQASQSGTMQPAQQSGLPTDLTQTPTQSPMGDNSLMADDADLIEKEWVVRAKALVAETKDDPYRQNKEFNKAKADYIKKRYNKDIKVSED